MPAPAPVVTNAVPSYATNSVLGKLPPQAAEVVRLSQAGTSEDIILSFIRQGTGIAVPLTADQVLMLKNMGVSPRVLRAMLDQQSIAQGTATNAQPPEAAAPGYSQTPDYSQAPGYTPPLEPGVAGSSYETLPADYAYYQNALAPFGTWSQVPSYGWCWQPTVCRGHPEWRPYCDNGHWLWTDCGWYWNSSYPWGWAPFHYGRWFHHERFGWQWQPARAWAPAWVCWREAPQYCGWAPLPPEAKFAVDTGWTFRGQQVDEHCDFGLPAAAFGFVPLAHLVDVHLVAILKVGQQAAQIFASSTIFNAIVVDAHKRVINPGIEVTKVETAAHLTLRPRPVDTLPANQRPPAALAGPNGQQPVPPPTGRLQPRTVPPNAPAVPPQPGPNGVRPGSNQAPPAGTAPPQFSPPAPTLPKAPTLPPSNEQPAPARPQQNTSLTT
ncbi:MAG: hypothetical protein C5B50_30190 [Verrucomicrobia bacterium]|nr:MAG: hypothetical protein C5B50_30190 [Verrucomicrobiota bacterium]